MHTAVAACMWASVNMMPDHVVDDILTILADHPIADGVRRLEVRGAAAFNAAVIAWGFMWIITVLPSLFMTMLCPSDVKVSFAYVIVAVVLDFTFASWTTYAIAAACILPWIIPDL